MDKVKKQKLKKTEAAKPKYNMWQNSWFMIKLAWTSGEKKVIILSLLSAALVVSLNLVNLYVSPTILSAVERHVSVRELFMTIAGFVLGLMLVSAASAYVNTNILFGRVSIRIEIANLLNRKAATTSYPNVDDDKFIKLLVKSRECTYSSNEATEAIWTTLTTLVTNITGFLIYVSLLTTVQPLLILIIIATTLISFFLGNYLNGYGYRHREEEAEYEKHMNYLSTRAEDLSAAKDIRIFGLRHWIKELYEKAMDCHTAFHRKAQGVYIWSPIADLVLTFLRNAIAYAFLISFVIRDGLGAAEFLLYFTAVGGFTVWVSGILSGFGSLYKQSLDLSTVRECLEYYEPFQFDSGSHIEAEAERKYEIRLENVSFRYPGAEQDTLININLTLHPGEKLAVVGLNGAGKTTLIKLICGFLDPTVGRVLLDGQDIRNYDRADYYTMFSAVFQDFSLLAGTIAVNVAQNDVGIDMERVKECVEKAGLRQKVESMPGGYETYLNREVYEEATLLSGGETQRLMLARALYKNAPFIILDEPTAALDPIAESEMYRKYHEVTGGRSSIYISHRLASTRFCDRIILIDNAGICEEGTHEELLKLGGKYAGLYDVQSKYYREGDAENE
ncbi:MAG: ABC transporter ATP-binding protein/permease [Lachnospiraceae bacterium]|nr:ABC transporter ATP-binding protein/permease [Lachnospiraceae bacterium]